jgi:Condensation domain
MMTTKNSGMRTLGAHEHFLWLLDQIEPVHFSVSALVEGETTVEEWHAALSAVQGRHALFHASIRIDSRGIPYFRDEPGKPIPLRLVEGEALAQLDREVAREIATPFPVGAAPLIRAVLLHEKHRCIIILVAHHSIADGISLVYAIRDLLQALSGKALNTLPLPPSHEESLGITDGIADEGIDVEAGNAFAKTTAPRNPKYLESVPHVESRLLTRELTENLRNRAREEGTSIQAALAAAVMLAVKELVPGADQACPHVEGPVSTRNLLHRGEESVLLTDGGLLDMSLPEPASFWELARQAKESLFLMQSLDLIRERRRPLHQVFAALPSPEEAVQLALQTFNADFALSNLGAVPLESQYGRLRLETLWGPGMLLGAFEDQNFIGVATMNGRLSFLYCSHAPIAQLLPTMERILIGEVRAEPVAIKISA